MCKTRRYVERERERERERESIQNTGKKENKENEGKGKENRRQEERRIALCFLFHGERGGYLGLPSLLPFIISWTWLNRLSRAVKTNKHKTITKTVCVSLLEPKLTCAHFKCNVRLHCSLHIHTHCSTYIIDYHVALYLATYVQWTHF